MKKVFLLLLFIPSFVLSQQIFTKAHGTLIFVATGIDGIMLAVDSRLSLSRNNEIIGIADGIDKLYNLKGFAVCFEGNGILDSTRFLSATFKEYNSLHRKKETFSKAITGYIEYMKKYYQKQLRNDLGKNIFIFAGFEKRKPYVTIWSPDNTFTTFNEKDSVFECTDAKAKEYFGVYNPKETCSQLAVKAMKAMTKYVEEDKAFKAGKPFRIVMIKPNNRIISLNKFRGKQFYNTATFERAVNNGEVKIFMIKEQ
ncbi:hypothetical protein FRZ67_20940 [Panacibacter ginsenosidivorans]|uniref:Proteasome subunit beta n=1 Tax=Panacibacter ginsenosidivorans TaxID=1813871 RepID=A0A5B8VH59_9BACT|nr:hypothetical protein [Panacibacter ginsenosidivorans]QEC69648.1 hypothetical protein FRZ67_20940 [Panacibacter ginsenosidivorans]